MTTLTIDASVVLKWIVPERDGERHASQALVMLSHLQQGVVSVLQPPHWLAEVAAVVSRLLPERALAIVDLLHAMELPVSDAVEVYERACQLGTAHGQHVFDTLYHAVALARPDGMLVTADERYYRSARREGRIALLKDYR